MHFATVEGALPNRWRGTKEGLELLRYVLPPLESTKSLVESGKLKLG